MMIFTPEMTQWLSENACGKMYDELLYAFNARFGTEFSKKQIQWKCARCGIATKTKYKHKAIGTVKMGANGLAYVKTIAQGKGWRLRHLVEWEATNGSLPKAHCVVFADGDK